MLNFLDITSKNKFGLVIAVVTLGISSIITQIIILREFLNVFFGNELVMGIILANWMLLTGLGAFMGRLWRYKGVVVSHILVLQVLIAFLPIVTVFLLNYLRNIIFITGSMVNMIEIFYSSFILLLPYCLSCGLLFTFFSVIISRTDSRNSISKVYSYEAIGSIIGGLGFNFLLIFVLSTFQSLKVILLINLLAALILAVYSGYNVIRYITLLLLFIAGFFVFNIDLDMIAKSYLYPGQEILKIKESPYGNIVVTKTNHQITFFENGIPSFSSENTIANEEDIHYSMVQRDSLKNVLLISGGLSGTIDEILKYPVKRIDYVELNPWLINVCSSYVDMPDTSVVNLISEDARIFIRKTDVKYDVVISNLPEPTTVQLNRYYTLEFFKEIKKILTSNAVFQISLPSTPNYISEEERDLNSILVTTLRKIFKNVLLIPGEKNYYLASDGTLNINISQLVKKRDIYTVYVNEYYIDDEIYKERSDEIIEQLDHSAIVNRDFEPVSSFSHLQYWLSYFHLDIRIIAGVLILLLLIFLILLNPVNLGMFTAGFTASSMEFLLIMSFQVLHGNIYQFTGVLITLFMAGLATGAIIGNNVVKDIRIAKYLYNQGFIGTFALVVPLIMLGMVKLSVGFIISEIVILMLVLIIGFFVGVQFNLASRLQVGEVKRVASSLYSADLFGSALGALIVAVFLLPLFGILKISFIIGILNFLVIMIIFVRRKIAGENL